VSGGFGTKLEKKRETRKMFRVSKFEAPTGGHVFRDKNHSRRRRRGEREK
jgi:hypothetical protein